jgi:hypothetical protein
MPVRVFALVTALLLASASPASAAPEVQRFATTDAVTRFMNGYRTKPEPRQLPAAFHGMADLGLLADDENASVYIGFTAGVIGTNQLSAEKLIAAMLPLRPDAEAALIKAIAWSGLPNWRGILNDFVWRMSDRHVLIDRYSNGQPKLLMEMPVDEGRTVDALWGYYLATGYYEPVQRIIGALAWSSDKNNLDRLVVGSMAKWTLASNASRDHELLQLLYTEQSVRPPAVATPLKDVIDAVEMAETARIKKEALAAIDELKAKGPASKRTVAWASQLGATAVAVGCVVAGVTGHVELGVPCIVTGAATEAAGKVATSDWFSLESFGFK